MRFFEFKLPDPNSSLGKTIQGDLDFISNAVEQKPEIENLVNPELQKLLAQAKATLSKVKTQNPAQKTQQVPNTPPAAGTNEDLDEDVAVYSLIDELSAYIDEICKVVKKCDPIVKPFKDKINLLRVQAAKSLASAVQTGKETRDVEIQAFFSGLEEQLRILAAKAAPDPKILKEIVIRFKSSFSDAILRDRKITQEDFKDFLNDAISGKVIDMSSLVKSDKGNIENFISDPKHKEIFEIIKDDVFGYIPGGTGANMGPGEVALTMFGNPIRKGEIGDLDIDGVMYEVKGGRTKGKESGYGGRLNGKQVQKPTSGFVLINNFFKKYLPSIDPVGLGKTGKKVSRFNWNTKGLGVLNDVVSLAVKKKEKRELLLKELMLTLWAGLINNRDEIKNFQERVYSMVNDQGLVDIEKAIKISTELLYESYAISDGQVIRGKPVFNIIILNAGTLNYQIIRSSKDISKVRIVGGISWTDANSSTSPQLYIP
jgi:hypothetical protein